MKSQKYINYKTGGFAQGIRRKQNGRHSPHGTCHSFQNIAKMFDDKLGNRPFLSGLKLGKVIGWVLPWRDTRAD